MDDPYIQIAERGFGFVEGMMAGAFLVDAVPFCDRFIVAGFVVFTDLFQ